jgi:hypothetical protein
MYPFPQGLQANQTISPLSVRGNPFGCQALAGAGFGRQIQAHRDQGSRPQKTGGLVVQSSPNRRAPQPIPANLPASHIAKLRLQPGWQNPQISPSDTSNRINNPKALPRPPMPVGFSPIFHETRFLTRPYGGSEAMDFDEFGRRMVPESAYRDSNSPLLKHCRPREK